MTLKKVMNASVLILLFLSACSKGTQNVPPPESGEKALYSIVIENPASTRSSEGATEDATGAEIALEPTHGLKVYVFDYNGQLEYSSLDDPNATNGRLPLTAEGADKYVTSAFEINSGRKYFFVFANDGTSGGVISPPGANWTIERFSEQIVPVTFTADVPSITGTNFLLGTLWKEVALAPPGGTDTEPETVELQIGRLVSKVNLIEVNYDTQNSDLLGDFSDARYRMGTIGRKIFTAGIHEGEKAPYLQSNVLVKSALHTSGPLTLPTDPDFVRYSDDWVVENEHFYVTENTTQIDPLTYDQYFGNTTYLQLETVYTPDPAEIYDPQTLTPGQTLDPDNTFWTVVIKDEPADGTITALAGKTLIVNSDPAQATLHPDIVAMTGYPEYDGGKNYHKFPVFDEGESEVEMRNRVLRNHYYEFTVTEFLSLGSHSPDVDPWEPIPNITTVNVRVTVRDWDKVTGSTPVG